MVGVIGTVGVPALIAAASFGVNRQQVKDMGERIDGQDARISKIETSVGEATSAARATQGDVALLGETVRSFKEASAVSHQAVLREVQHLGEIWTLRLDALRRPRQPRARPPKQG